MTPTGLRLKKKFKCDPSFSLWRKLWHMQYYAFYQTVIWSLKTVGLFQRGHQNAYDIQLQNEAFYFHALPQPLQQFRILFLTDFHLDNTEGIADKIVEHIKDIHVDLCLVGGDICTYKNAAMKKPLQQLTHILAHVKSRHGIFGVLGNHDCIEMLPYFKEAGLSILINDSHVIKQDGSELWIVGIDDPHYYKTHDVELAFSHVPTDAPSIIIAHSPEAYREASQHGPLLYLCGHTHGGQVCLPGGYPVFTHSRAQYKTATGRWQCGNMAGYTSKGIGTSRIPIRFNCASEITLITLYNNLTSTGV